MRRCFLGFAASRARTARCNAVGVPLCRWGSIVAAFGLPKTKLMALVGLSSNSSRIHSPPFSQRVVERRRGSQLDPWHLRKTRSVSCHHLTSLQASLPGPIRLRCSKAIVSERNTLDACNCCVATNGRNLIAAVFAISTPQPCKAQLCLPCFANYHSLSTRSNCILQTTTAASR